MKSSRLLTAIALLPLGCVQGGQQMPPPRPPLPPPSWRLCGSSPAPRTEAEKAPARPASAPTAERAVPEATQAPARVRLIVPAGTLLPIEIQTPVSTATSQEGDPVLAVLTEDVPLQGFKLDKGAEVRGSVLTAVSAKRVKGRAPTWSWASMG